ncbi:DNA adenine methylase [Pseudomonas gingeri]|uniref:DNA adenine methylase n=1 Tax=Pseudomonas gingeri TaxID=117681 RepID=UPI0015A28A2D|nr:DNA adenine methylase [Pseudomonas gingeri]NWD70758.1 DNA adenine methylase [Pseudomonas gingeri]
MSASNSFVTPLRYPGGKGRLGVWLAQLIEHNDLQDGCYVEPYAGGAGAAVYLLLNNYIKQIVINDLDPVVHAFWWALLNDTEELVEKIWNTPVTMDTWYEQKAIITTEDASNLSQLGFATFFLNRTNRSGIIKGGVIGGKDQKGNYKLDARYNKEDLTNRIRRLGAMRDQIQLLNMDAMTLLTSEVIDINENTLVYLDPPYYKKGSQLYRNHYQPEDHAAISETVKKMRTPWLVTYDNCDEINLLYSDAKGVEFSLHYSTHLARPKAQEALFYGNLHLKSMPSMKR